MTSRHCSGCIRCKVVSRVIPALLTSTSIGPSSASTLAMPSWHAWKSDTSHLWTGTRSARLNLAAASSLPP